MPSHRCPECMRLLGCRLHRVTALSVVRSFRSMRSRLAYYPAAYVTCFLAFSRSQPVGTLLRCSAALAPALLLSAWVEQQEAVVVPHNHPANPHARPAPPIAIPRLRGPDIKEIIPDPARETPSSPQSSSPSPRGEGAPIQHQHH